MNGASSHVCTRCRRPLRRGAEVLCRIRQRPAARIALDGKVTRFTDTIVQPFCADCEAHA